MRPGRRAVDEEGTTVPAWVRAAVKALAPEEFADDLLADLADVYTRRTETADRARARLLLELARTPWLRLHAQARRMRAAGTRRELRVRGRRGLPGFGLGLRVAARSLLRRPQYAGIQVLTLAVSIGAATLIFSVLEGVLLRPLPYPGAERVHRIFATNESWRTAPQEVLRQSWDRIDITEDMVVALRGRVPGAETLGAYTKATLRLDDGLDPVQLPGAHILPGFFETLPMRPLLGRLPTPEETDAGTPVVVLSERLWTSRYGRDREIIGRQVSLAGQSHTVIGILPGAFAVPDELARWWAPVPANFADGQTSHAVFVGLVRLSEGSDAASVAEGMKSVGAQMAETNPTYASMGVRLQPLSELLVAEVRDGILLLFLAVAIVVLIGSVNLANLTVAGSARRRGELMMRAALGASRWELVWTLLSETTLICALGAALGVLLATQLLDPFLSLLARASEGFPRTENVRVNGTVMMFSAGVTILTAVLSGLFPALSASNPSRWEALQQGRRTRGSRATRRTQRSLLLVEGALATALLGVAGLLTRSALYLSTIDPGFDSESVAFVSVEMTGERYDTPEEAHALGAALEARLSMLPGVQSVAAASAMPALGNASGKLVWLPTETSENAQLAWYAAVSNGYFDAMGITLEEGRAFTDADGPDDPKVVVVSEFFAQRYFPGVDAVGQTLMMGMDARLEGGKVVPGGEVSVTVVGVASDVRQLAIVADPDPGLYLPMRQTPGTNPKLILRTEGDPADVLQAARAEIRAQDPSLLVSDAQVLAGAMQRLLAPLSVRMALIVALAALAAFLTAVGIYGVVAYVVSDQLHEIGVRMALGARSGGEMRRVVRHALRPVVFGALLGLVGAWGAGGLVQSELFGVETLDPATYLGVVALISSVSALAAWVPARRAAAVDPVQVLNDP